MTRARHHLIISGALGGNGGAAEAPIARLCHTLDVDLEDEGRVAVGRTSLDVRVVRPRADEPPQPGEGQLPLFQDPLEPPADLPELEVPPAPPANAVRRLSYSGLQQHARCGYRFYAQRLLGLPERVEPRARGRAAWSASRSATRCTCCWSARTSAGGCAIRRRPPRTRPWWRA